MPDSKFRAVVLASLAALPTGGEAVARDTNPLAAMAGSWSGAGSVRFEGGRTERLSCRGRYTTKPNGVGIALRCASASANIDLHSTLSYRAGRVFGSWEERSFNASGSASGRASSGSMKLAISGGGLSGSMSVSFSGSSQSVSINTSGTGLRSVSIRLRR